MPVTTLLAHGEAANTLIDLSVTAAMVVVGLHSPCAMRAGVTRRVAAHARSAVVAIPEGRTLRWSNRGVTVFSTGAPADAYALAVAAEEAQLRGEALATVNLRDATPSVADAFAIGTRSPALVVVPVARGGDRGGDRLDPAVSDLLAHAAWPVMVVGEPASS